MVYGIVLLYIPQLDARNPQQSLSLVPSTGGSYWAPIRRCNESSMHSDLVGISWKLSVYKEWITIEI